MPTSRYIYEDGTTDAERYLQGCLDGKYVVGERIKQLAKKMLREIKEGYQGFHYDPQAAIRPVEWIETFCMLSSGKLGVPFVLEPYERNIIELIFGFVDAKGFRRFQEAFIVIGRKNGKGVSVDQELPTPSGWRKMGDLHVGDVVFGQDGKPSAIIAESEIFDKPTYIITFEDGSSFKVTDDHIWTVQTKRSRRCANGYLSGKTNQTKRRKYREGGWFETTTQEMFDDPCFIHHRADGKGVEYKYRIPMNLPVEYPEKDLPIDPYTFGYWLGDGAKDKALVTVSASDLEFAVDMLEKCGHRCDVYKNKDRADSILIDAGERGVTGSNPFKNALRQLGVLNNKHIPDIYLQASIGQRWELLRGLMDTDGYVSKAGQCQFVQKDRVMIEQFVELCSSLGIKANMNSKEARCNGNPAGTVYQVEFWTDKSHSCFHLKRKHERLKDKLAPRMSCKSIVSIERIPNEPTKCIAIDNASHLYLVGRQYTATHNTELCAALNLYMLTSDGEGAPQCYNIASTESQAATCYGATERMLKQSKRLGKYVKRETVVERKTTGLTCAMNMGYLVTLSRNTDALDGLNPHYAVVDEVGAMRDRSGYDLIKGGLGSRDQPLVFSISTNGKVRDGLFDANRNYAIRWLEGAIDDPRFIGILYEMDDRAEVQDEAMWPKANPGLGTVKKWDYLRNEVTRGNNDPTYMPEVMTKQFNLPSNQSSAFLTWEQATCRIGWEFDPREFKYCYIGIDSSDSIDLSALVAAMMRPGDDHIYLKSMFWIPEEQVKKGNHANMEGNRDGVPYLEWARNDHIRIVPQSNTVPKTVFLEYIQELASMGIYCRGIGYDQWHMQEIEDKMKMLVGEANVVRIPQWPKSLSDPMKRLRADLSSGRFIWNSPVLDWNFLNVSASIDNNDNYFPVKKNRTSANRIDGFMATLDVYALLLQRWDEFQAIIN